MPKIHVLVGGYKCTAAQIEEWAARHGVELRPDCYSVICNRYLIEHNSRALVRSCDYERQHCYVVLTHKVKYIDDYVAIRRKYRRFEEDDNARSIKAEMGLHDVEFVTTAQYIGGLWTVKITCSPPWTCLCLVASFLRNVGLPLVNSVMYIVACCSRASSEQSIVSKVRADAGSTSSLTPVKNQLSHGTLRSGMNHASYGAYEAAPGGEKRPRKTSFTPMFAVVLDGRFNYGRLVW